MPTQLIHRLQLLLLGGVAMALAALLPIYLRAVDSEVVKTAGLTTKTVTAAAEEQLLLERPGITALLLEAAEKVGIPDLEEPQAAYQTFRLTNPDLNFFGGAFPHLDPIRVTTQRQEATVMEAFINEGHRTAVLRRLQESRRPGIKTLLDNRLITRMAIFPPVTTPGGGALDAVIIATSLLSQNDSLKTSLRKELERHASEANRGNSTHQIEAAYLDLLSLARKMNWAQFSGFVSRIDSLNTLRSLVHALATPDTEIAVVFAASWLAPSPDLVATYLRRFPESGMVDLGLALSTHQGGLAHLLQRQERIHHSTHRQDFLRALGQPPTWNLFATMALRFPWTSLLTKYVAILLGSFFWLRLAFDLVPRSNLVPVAFRVDGIATLRQQILALGVLAGFVLLGEPFLAQNRESDETPLNWRFPTAPAAVAENVDAMVGENIDEVTMLALVLFFLVQAALYALGLVKVKEIERQKVSSRLKLKLLDNEDNMFDAGLYVGLGGTVLSLLILTLNLAQVGLMAAYASTLFGIIFVSLLKIFHVRPVRRKILIEAEAGIL